jgi:alkaline phosphatase/alkaline phosphatase D
MYWKHVALAGGFGLFVAAAILLGQGTRLHNSIELAQGLMAGEVTESSVLLQSRLTRPVERIDTRWSGIPGAPGFARFEVADNANFANALLTPIAEAHPATDFIVRQPVTGLRSGVVYHYRLQYGPTRDLGQVSPAARFRTLPGKGSVAPVSLAIVTGMNYSFFHHTGGGGYPPASAEERRLGYPSLQAILRAGAHYFVATGDNVYYDHPALGRAQTLHEMRKKHHEQYSQPRFLDLFRETATFWMKDDHDHRWDDSDPHTSYRGGAALDDQMPYHDLGLAVFKEQLPVADPATPDAITYRTHRLNRDLQIWLVEGRDYRSPNGMPDGPAKSIWGPEQRAWLQRTLLASDATFKLLISPTPLVGPDDARKKDNHTNIGGFRNEGASFFNWVREYGMHEAGLVIATGDRHWQYHSIHPSGVNEFGSGALVRQNSRVGRKPGDPESTDPEARVQQPFTNAKPTGGFLLVRTQPAAATSPATLEFLFIDDEGTELYRHRMQRQGD